MHSYPHLINGTPECYVNLKFGMMKKTENVLLSGYELMFHKLN